MDLRRRALFTLVLACVLVAPEARTEGPSEKADAGPRVVRRVLNSGADLVRDTVVDGVGIILSPFKWRTKEWLTVGAVGGATALFIVYADDPIRRHAQANSGFRSFGDKIRPLGTGPGIAALTGGMLLTGVIFDREKERETARLLIESTAISYVIESSLKHAIGRARPSSELGPRSFEFFGGDKSMPSGEVTLAFSMAGVITSQYDQWWVKLLAYSLAAAVGAGRIARDSHWASDVVLSAALGTAVAKSVVWRHRRREQLKSNAPRWEFGLTPTGVRYTYIW